MRILFLLYAVLLALASFSPLPDITAASWFYNPNAGGFWLREAPIPDFLHEAIQIGARLLAVLLVIAAVANKHRKAALFLLVALIIGPGIITNPVLKDNWDRARPLQIQEFGGSANYTPPLQPTDQCEKNCSFVSGDGALGFFLHAFFYVVAPERRRRVFLAGFVGGGVICGGLRIMMGAHFLSDVLWAGVLMLITTALTHMALYGRQQTKAVWKSLFG